MASFMNEYEHLKIQLKDIKLATNDFDEKNVIGRGGFGKVYKGKLWHSNSENRNLVALKRLDRKHGQGDPQFWKEIMMLSRYRHENLISLLGYCIEDGERILIYEHASRGSLERYLKDANLTWTQRIKICLDAAKGLSFLHDPNERQQRVLHCDIKSANILLDDNLNAKVSDFGLSKMGATGPQYSVIITDTVGTHGYCDPLYMDTYQLTKESDVYSFGVVLFEVLCGRQCVEVSNDQIKVYVPSWKKAYEDKKLLDGIVLEDLKKQMTPTSFKMFTDIAYHCLNKIREERPSMSLVVKNLEKALKVQEPYDLISRKIPKEYHEIVKAASDRFVCRSLEELKELLLKGVLLNDGRMWLYTNEKEERCVLISIEECLIQDDPNTSYSDSFLLLEDSRFPVRCYKTHNMNFKVYIRTPLFLSPDVTYRLNLVFHYSDNEREKTKQQHVGVSYKFRGETKISVLHFEDRKEYKQLVAGLYQFNSTQECISDFEILLEDCGFSGDLYIQGIEFQPLKNVRRPEVVANKEIVRAVASTLFYGLTKEPEMLFSQGVLLNKGNMLFCLNEKGQHIQRIFIQACLNPDEAWKLKHCDDCLDSRFPRGRCYLYYNEFKASVRGEYLTPQISYTLNLVFRFEDESDVNSYNHLRYKVDGDVETKVFIIYPTDMREDGLFVVPLYHFTSQHTTADLQFEFQKSTSFLLVAGFEFQPSEEKVELQVFKEYQHILEVASQSLIYTSFDELKQILSKGVHLNGYKTWFSLNTEGEHCEMISIEDCLIPNEDFTPRYQSYCRSSFPASLYQTNNKAFETHVKTRFLSPLITYTVNLVFCDLPVRKQAYVDLKYRLKGDSTTSTLYLADRRYGDWLYLAELYQFAGEGSIVDLEIMFDSCETYLRVEGILFMPLDSKLTGHLKQVEDVPAKSDSGILKLLNNTKNKAYSSLGKWFQFNNDTSQEWSYLDKNEKKCVMLSARVASFLVEDHFTWRVLPESRFGEVLLVTAYHKFKLVYEIKPELLPAQARYATYFVYKLPSDQNEVESPLQVGDDGEDWHDICNYIYLASPQNTPVIGQKFDENSYNPLNRHKPNALPRLRSDGWMEVKVWEFETSHSVSVLMCRKLKYLGENDLSGLLIHGIELRPI